MPTYQVRHAHPLTASQRQRLAAAITDLHGAAFGVPAFFVHVSFHHDPPPSPPPRPAAEENDDDDDGGATYFIAGEARPRGRGANTIAASVRSGASRSREDFDALAGRIEEAWDGIVGVDREGCCEGGGGGSSSVEEMDARRLVKISFSPMLAVREGSMAAPVAGEEAAWMRDNLPFVRRMAALGLPEFRGLAEEGERRGL